MRAANVTSNEINMSERAWDAMRRLVFFTIPDVVALSGVTHDLAKVVTRKLRTADYVRRLPGPPARRGTHACFEVIRDPGGVPNVVSKRRVVWRQQVWNTLRVKTTATLPEILATMTPDVSIQATAVRRYLRNLERAGYVAADSQHHAAPKENKLHRLVKDQPKAPSRQHLLHIIDEKQETARAGVRPEIDTDAWRDRVWRYLQTMEAATSHQVARHCDLPVKRTTVYAYLRRLANAGYLDGDGVRDVGAGAGRTVFRLVKPGSRPF